MPRRNLLPVWILCPNLWGARIFRYGRALLSREGYDGGAVKLEFLRELTRPSVHTRLEDFPNEDDEIEQIYSPVEDPAKEEQVASDYMEFVAQELERGCASGEFNSLILCAEPHLLKILKSKITSACKERVVGTVPLDLYEANESDLVNYIEDILGKKAQTRRGVA